MSAPAFPKTRFFHRLSDGAWLRRVDTQSPLSLADAVAHCGSEYGFAVGVVEIGTLRGAEVDALRQATRWAGTAPARPTVSATAAERVLPPPQPPSTEEAARLVDRAAFAAATAAEKLSILARRLGLE